MEDYQIKYNRINLEYQGILKQRDQLQEQLDLKQRRIRKLSREISCVAEIILILKPELLSSDESSEEESKITESSSQLLIEDVPKKRKQRRDTRGIAKKPKILPIDSNGKLTLPVVVGKNQSEVTIHSIGEIISTDAFHSTRYIWPLGFQSTKQFISLLDVTTKSLYWNRILQDPVTKNPIFEVQMDGCPQFTFRASSATGAWKKVLMELHSKGYVSPKTNMSGPDLFGLSDMGIVKFIQDQPESKLCKRYVPQIWEDE